MCLSCLETAKEFRQSWSQWFCLAPIICRTCPVKDGLLVSYYYPWTEVIIITQNWRNMMHAMMWLPLNKQNFNWQHLICLVIWLKGTLFVWYQLSRSSRHQSFNDSSINSISIDEHWMTDDDRARGPWVQLTLTVLVIQYTHDTDSHTHSHWLSQGHNHGHAQWLT